MFDCLEAVSYDQRSLPRNLVFKLRFRIFISNMEILCHNSFSFYSITENPTKLKFNFTAQDQQADYNTHESA
jgi:hypothetical protein